MRSGILDFTGPGDRLTRLMKQIMEKPNYGIRFVLGEPS